MITTDQHLSFSIAYAMYYERMGGRFYSRLDNLISFLLLVSGMAAVSEAVNPFLLGLFITVLTAWQFIYAPATKAVAAKNQEQRYADLLERFSLHTESEVREKLLDLRKHDSDLPGCLELPAYAAACRKLNATNQYLLSRLERFAAWFCG